MKKQTRKKQRGASINTYSSAALVGDFGIGWYCAAKATLANLTKPIGANHAREDTRINAVCPGWTETAMAKSLSATPEAKELVASSTPMYRPATPEELAAVMLFLASEDASNVTGSGLLSNQQYHSLSD